MAAKLTEPKLTADQARWLVKEVEEEEERRRWEADPRPQAPAVRVMGDEPVPPVPEGYKRGVVIRIIIVPSPREKEGRPVLVENKSDGYGSDSRFYSQQGKQEIKGNNFWRRLDAPPGSYNGLTDTPPD
jgi:hypothetical protein